MKLEHYPVERLREELIGIISKHLDLSKHRAFFFGSRVAGKSAERSDIDIGIEGPDEIPLETMARIRDEIEALPTLYIIQVMDFSNVSSAPLLVNRQVPLLLSSRWDQFLGPQKLCLFQKGNLR